MSKVKSKPADEIASELSYEAAFAQLEIILQTLEIGELPLEESLTLYEQGINLATYCTQKLDEAELRVSRWQPGHQTTPFVGWQEG
ncbi:MAG: exodeoxyribonuclease VII small subunit [Chloroflexi bacterium]|nr:exodeoxyribonuclease VII small subunit [Chloroflexota bacterium]